MFERAGKRKQKQQRRTFGPRTDAGSTGGDEDHEKMHVDGAFLETFPNFFRRIKTAREIGKNVSRHRPMAGQQKMRGQSKNAAKNCGGKLRFPFVNLLRVFKKFDVALDDLGKRNIAPAPEFRRGRASDAGDGGRLAVVLDGDFFPLGFGQRPVATPAIVLAIQQRAREAGVSGLRHLKFCRDAFSQPADPALRDAAERGDGDFLARAVNRHRLERRFLGERVHDRAREALPAPTAAPGMLFER